MHATTATRSLVASAAFAFAFVASAGGPLLAYEGFGNGPLPDLQGSNGGTGWTTAWADAVGILVTGIESNGLTFPGLDVTPGSAITGTDQVVYPMTRYHRSFGTLPLGTNAIYVSFLMRADESFGWGGLRFGNYPFAMTVGVPAGMGAFGLMLSEGLGDVSNAPLNPGETYLVVVKISKNTPGAGITYRLYLNPTPGGAEPSFPLAQYGSGPVNALPTGLDIENGGNFFTDEIRVGTTWASVTPIDSCASDVDGDGTVGAADLTLVLSGWGTSSPDLTGDGIVNGVDLAQLLATWGACP